MAKLFFEVLTDIEQRYVLVEDLIDQANQRCAHLNRVCGRSNNLDLFTPDLEVIEWRKIRAALDAESERLESQWQGSGEGYAR